MDRRTERRILQKASYVADAVEVLAGKRDSLTFQAYCDSREDRDVVEREFETAIEACLDIAKMLLRVDGESVPETNAETVRRLGELGYVDEETARRMAMAAGFRNVLSHRYGDAINDEDVFNFLQNDLPLFHDYLSEVRDALAEQNRE